MKKKQLSKHKKWKQLKDKQTPASIKIPFTKRKKAKYLNKPYSRWKLPTFLTVLSLFFIILVIPTLIVNPFVKGDKRESAAMEKKQDIVIKPSSSPVSVAVMRMNTEEVEDIPLEEYVVGVVASEMGAGFEPEALKAQGLAARTYVVNHLLHQEDSEEASVTDTTSDQVYKDEEDLRKIWGKDYQGNLQKLTEAVNATKGEIITHKSKPIMPAYFSTSNGYTENSEDYWENELPYLRSVQSPWDKVSPKYLKQEIFTFSQIKEKLDIDFPTNASLQIEVSRTESERVKELNLAGHLFTGREIREKLGLQSSDFTIKQNNDHLIFTTKGYGHGIGMSQYGANEMAKQGKDYQDIIKHYYKDVEISTLTETAPTLVAK